MNTSNKTAAEIKAEIKAAIVNAAESANDYAKPEAFDASESGWRTTAELMADVGDEWFVSALQSYDAAQKHTPAAYTITNRTSGLCLGTYEGESESEALEAMLKDAGYKSLDDAAQRVPDFDEDDFMISEV